MQVLGSTSDWIIALSTTVLGVLLSEGVAYLLAYREVRRRIDLKGDWLSLSATGETSDPVRDTVKIGVRRGKLHLTNQDKTGGFEYEAFCRVRDNTMLVGPWHSLRPGAIAPGQLLLQIDAQGQYMYGVYSGIHSDGRHMLLAWVLGRKEEDLNRAVGTLRTSTALSMRAP